MKEKFYFLPVILLLMVTTAWSQVPVIQKIEPQSNFPNLRILITGSGFSSDKTKLQVWFDHIRGTIVTSTDFSIEVDVPAQARLATITVVNLTSRLSAQSKARFMPVFSGEAFDPAKLDAPFMITSSNAIFDIISADIDGDNKPDLIGSRFENTATTMALALNQSTIGNILFSNTNIPSLNINAPTGHLAIGDLNGDGKPDVVASRSGSTANSVFVLVNTSTVGNPGFATPVTLILDATHFARQVEVADLNGDGKPEIIVANSSSSELYIFRNESAGGTLNINSTPVKITVTGASETLALDVKDFDGDGKFDIVATRNQNPDIFLLKNTSSASVFSFTVSKLPIGGQFNDVTSADFNKDGRLDIVATSLFTSQAQVFINQSTSVSMAFSATPITLATDSQPFGVDVSDLNGDGFPDFIIPIRGAATLNAYIHNGNISAVGFTKVVVPTAKNNWFVRAGDLDGDAKPDIAFTSFTGTTGPFSMDILRNKNCHKPQILNELPLSLCASQTIKLETIPIPGVTFDWSNGFNVIKSSTDPFADVSISATYTVTAKGVVDNLCAVVSSPVVIQSGAGTVPSDPVITTNAPICVGSALTLSTPPVSGATYSWKGPGNFSSNLSNISIPAATIANAGMYSLTVKVGDCSSNTVTKNVDIATFGSFSISSSVPSNSICQGQSLTLTINTEPGYSFQWMKDNANISGQTSSTLVVNTDGAYKVKVNNTLLGCSQETSAVTVETYLTPVAAFTSDAGGCVGNVIAFDNVTVSDPKVTAVIYSWDFGDNSTSALQNPTHIYSTAQTFSPKLTVSYSGVTGCTSTVTKSITIKVGTIPVLSATEFELCANGTGLSSISVAGTFSQYNWSTGATASFINVTLPGEYSVDTVDPTGCEGSASISITEKTDCGPGIVVNNIPLVFTPNGDTQNDFWIIPDIENKQECTMNVFDGRGRKVLEKKGFPIGGWDGVSDEGKQVPDGTYYYILNCPDQAPVTGSVLIVR